MSGVQFDIVDTLAVHFDVQSLMGTQGFKLRVGVYGIVQY